MPFFRELPAKLILLLHLILGVVTGWFFVQGFKLMLGRVYVGGIAQKGLFYRIWGLQLSTFIFILVWLIDLRVWKKKRTPMPRSRATAKEIGLLFASILLYGVGAAAINMIRFL